MQDIDSSRVRAGTHQLHSLCLTSLLGATLWLSGCSGGSATISGGDDGGSGGGGIDDQAQGQVVARIETVLSNERRFLLRATLPAGTLSGAPKIRAMEIIDSLEPSRRGIYGGAVGYVSWQGEMDTAIAIRTAVIKDGLLHVQAGAGVVADSVPELEWEETLSKARAMMRAAAMSGG